MQEVTGPSSRNICTCVKYRELKVQREHKCPHSTSLSPVPSPLPAHSPALQEPKGATLHWKPSLWELKLGLKKLSLLMLVEVSHSLERRKIWKSLTTQARLQHLCNIRIPQCKHLLGQALVGTVEDNAICHTHFSLLKFLICLQQK